MLINLFLKDSKERARKTILNFAFENNVLILSPYTLKTTVETECLMFLRKHYCNFFQNPKELADILRQDIYYIVKPLRVRFLSRYHRRLITIFQYVKYVFICASFDVLH